MDAAKNPEYGRSKQKQFSWRVCEKFEKTGQDGCSLQYFQLHCREQNRL